MMSPATTAPDAGMDIAVLAQARDWLRAGERVALVTVLRTWGSSPRPPGSLLAMSAAGALAGSVSGGCVEAELLARFQAGELAEPFPILVDFGVDSDQASRLAALGLSPDQLDRLRGPAGLDIGSKRPAEIALAILAEITAVRNGLVGPADLAV
jgi:xanthine/CO dehydrogenase XdhC/CoxF family maturation factor